SKFEFVTAPPKAEKPLADEKHAERIDACILRSSEKPPRIEWIFARVDEKCMKCERSDPEEGIYVAFVTLEVFARLGRDLFPCDLGAQTESSIALLSTQLLVEQVILYAADARPVYEQAYGKVAFIGAALVDIAECVPWARVVPGPHG